MEKFCNRKRYRGRDQYSSYKNKKRTYNPKYSDERNYDSYKSSKESYSYRSRNDYEPYGHDTGHNNFYYVY